MFRQPTRARQDELRRLLDDPGFARDGMPRVFIETPVDALEAEYHAVLGPAGVPACETSFVAGAMASRGPLLADVAGFYRAFGYRGSDGARGGDDAGDEVPDHVGVELDFLSYLATKIAFAVHEDRVGARDVARAAYDEFLEQHARAWMPEFCDRVEAAGSLAYSQATVWLRRLLESRR
jgi:nitrate reductase assembly molybdenum cofactor insertion protein NarJ